MTHELGTSWWNKTGNIFHALWFILVLVTVLCIPFHKVFPVFPLIFSGMAGILAAIFTNPLRNLLNNRVQLLAILLYLIPIYAWYISTDRAIAALDLQVKFSLWVIPFIFAINRPFSAEQIRWLMRSIVLACIVFILVALAIATWHLLAAGENYFNYKKLVSFTFIHPSYIGMFINFSIGLLLYDMSLKGKKGNWLPLGISSATILLMFVFLIMLTSKNAVILAILMLLLAAWLFARKTGNIKKAVGLSGAVVLLFTLFVVLNPTTRERFTMLYRFNEVTYDNSVNSREETWSAVVELIGSDGLKGSGSGDAQKELNDIYTRNGFELGVEENHNAHNQYLQIIIEAGIAGFLVFSFVMGICIWYATSDRNMEYGLFLMVFLFSILTEAMLETQSGVVFFVVFNSIFLSQRSLRAN